MVANAYLTVTEAAALHGVAAMTIYRALWAGRFPGATYYGSGKRKVWLLPRESVEKWRPGYGGRKRGEG